MKLNKLLPIVAFTGIATVAMPLVTSCSKGPQIPTGPVLVDTPFSIEIGGAKAKGLTSKEIIFDGSIEYTIRIKWSDALKQGLEDAAGNYGIICGDFSGSKINEIVKEKTTASILGVKDLTAEDFLSGQGTIFAPLKKLELNENDVLEIKFNLIADQIEASTGWVYMLQQIE